MTIDAVRLLIRVSKSMLLPAYWFKVLWINAQPASALVVKVFKRVYGSDEKIVARSMCQSGSAFHNKNSISNWRFSSIPNPAPSLWIKVKFLYESLKEWSCRSAYFGGGIHNFVTSVSVRPVLAT